MMGVMIVDPRRTVVKHMVYDAPVGLGRPDAVPMELGQICETQLPAIVCTCGRKLIHVKEPA